MPRELVYFPVNDFSGGMNDNLNVTTLKSDELSLIRNWWWNGATLEERPGITKVNATAISGTPAVQGLVDFIRNEGADQDFITVAGGKVYKGTSTLSEITGSVSITSGQDNFWTFAVFQDILIAAGKDAPWKWTGSGNVAALGGSPPTGKYVVTKWNYLFLSGISTDLGLVRYADLNTLETWTGGNEIRVRTYGDDYVTGLVSYGDLVLALGVNSIQKIVYTGDASAPFTTDILLQGVGCPHQRSFVNVDDRGYFIDQHLRVRRIAPSDRIIAFNVPDLSTAKIPNTLKNLSLSRRFTIVGAYYRPFNSVIWTVSQTGATENNFCIVMNIEDEKPKFATWDELKINAMVPVVTTTGTKLYLGNYAGRIYSLEGNSDDSTAIASQIDTRWEDLDSPQFKKSLREIHTETIQPGGTNLKLRTFADYSPTPVDNITIKGNVSSNVSASQWGLGAWGTATWPSGAAGTELVHRKSDMKVSGRFIKLQFYQNTVQTLPRIALCRYTLFEKGLGSY